MIGQSPRMLFELDQTDDTQRVRDQGPGEATVRIGVAAAVPAVLRSLGADPGRGRGRGGVRPGTVDDPDNLISYAALHLRRRSRRRFFALRRCRRLPQSPILAKPPFASSHTDIVQRFDVQPDATYAVKVMAQYVLTAAGILIAADILSIGWSDVQ